MIAADDETLTTMAKVLAKQTNLAPYEDQPEEVQQQLLDDARELWGAVFDNVDPLGGWWLKPIVMDPQVEMLFIVPQEQLHPGTLIRQTGPEEISTVAHHTNRNWSDDGRTTHFQVSKIGKTS